MEKYKIKIVNYLLYTISALLIVVYLFYYTIATFIIGVTFTTPVIYMIASIMVAGVFLESLFLKRKISKDKKRNGEDQLH